MQVTSSSKMRLKDLESELSQVDSFENPKGECE